MKRRLDDKLQRMRDGRATRRDFIIADAKDADMAFGVAATGTDRATGRPRSLAEYREQIRAIVQQDVVDIMLLSASNLEQLVVHERVFAGSAITPAVRANDTTDIWIVRGGRYHLQPSRAFRSASLEHTMRGGAHAGKAVDLGLYSITFTNNLDADYASLQAFQLFREEAGARGFRYFLEVFNPNVSTGLAAEQVPGFVNDHIIRTLAGLTRAERPVFLKVPYNGPAALEELVAYDPDVVVGIMGGGAGTTLDAFQLIHDAQKYGARVALFGRKINHAEHPLSFITWLRRIVDGTVAPAEAVRAYHADLARLGLPPWRSLEQDLQLTSTAASYR